MTEVWRWLQPRKPFSLPAELHTRKSRFFCGLPTVCWFRESTCSKCALMWKLWREELDSQAKLNVALQHGQLCEGLAFIVVGFLALRCMMAVCKEWFAKALWENREHCVAVKAWSSKCCCRCARRAIANQLQLTWSWQNVWAPMN